MPFLQYHTKVKIIFDYLFVRVKNSAYLGEKKILKNFDDSFSPFYLND